MGSLKREGYIPADDPRMKTTTIHIGPLRGRAEGAAGASEEDDLGDRPSAEEVEEVCENLSEEQRSRISGGSDF